MRAQLTRIHPGSNEEVAKSRKRSRLGHPTVERRRVWGCSAPRHPVQGGTPAVAAERQRRWRYAYLCACAVTSVMTERSNVRPVSSRKVRMDSG